MTEIKSLGCTASITTSCSSGKRGKKLECGKNAKPASESSHYAKMGKYQRGLTEAAEKFKPTVQSDTGHTVHASSQSAVELEAEANQSPNLHHPIT